MRNLKFFALASILSAFIICPQSISFAHYRQASNYVVIGAFAVEKNAVKFTSYAKRHNFNAHFDLNANRNLFYVYVLQTPDHEKALTEARRLRSETEFSDAWVFDGQLGNTGGEDINPVTQAPIEEVKAEDTQPEPVAVVEEPKQEVVKPAEDDETEGKKFIFNLYRGSDNTVVEGDVDEIDTDRSRKVASYKGNTPVRVASPNSKTGAVSFVAQVFGYRKVQHEANYNTPVNDDIKQDEDGNYIVPFELIRLRKGDISVMYNVFFYKDAAIMRPESQYEINSLLQMLEENPKYKIRIHGHTNGSAPGKIISRDQNPSFFSLDGTKEGYGTAAKLSEERGKAIRDYLVSKGIDTKRMDVKAWGGKHPLYDKLSNKAGENVRVEIEILEDK